MTNSAMSISDLKAVLTDDYINSLQTSLLFTKELIGKTFELLGADVDPRNEDSVLIKVKTGTKVMTWFASNFLNNIKDSDGTTFASLCLNGKIPGKFSITNFELSSDIVGLPYYSKRIYDFRKLKEKFPQDFKTYTNRNATREDKQLVNAVLRENVAILAHDANLADGAVTQSAMDKFALGSLVVSIESNFGE